MQMNEVTKAALELTQQWAVEELGAARSRTMGLRVGGAAYNEAIGAVDNLVWLINRIGSALENAAVFEEPAPKPKPTKAVDISEVRTKAKAARDAGVKLTEVWAKFGGTKLSDVPSEKYGELLDMLDELMQEND
jgi:hypothetical protein